MNRTELIRSGAIIPPILGDAHKIAGPSEPAAPGTVACQRDSGSAVHFPDAEVSSKVASAIALALVWAYLLLLCAEELAR